MNKPYCFWVTGEALTNIARAWWADEDEPAKAVRFLTEGLQEITTEQVFEILTGRAKLTGDSRNGGVVEFVPDDAKLSPNGNPLLSLIEVMEREKKHRLAVEYERRDAIAFLNHDTELMASPTGARVVSHQTARALRNKEVTWEDIALYREYMPHGGGVLSPIMLPAPEEEDEEPEPQPPESFPCITQETGWLSPEGKFYPCEYMEHNSIAYRLKTDAVHMEKEGWVKMQTGSIWETEKTPTQKQRDLVFDWCTQQKKDLPYWMKPEEDV